MRRFWPLLSLVYLLSVVLAQTSLAGVPSDSASQSDKSPAAADGAQHPTIGGMGLVAPAIGWALLDQHLLWTSNDGKDWRELSPSNSAHIDGVFFLDSVRGWVVLSDRDPEAEQDLRVTVASTQDGGITWALSPLELRTEGRHYSQKASVFFFDGVRGWLNLRLASSSNFSFGLMFNTQDSGKTWTQLSDPPTADPVYFATPNDGWIAGGPAGNELWVTRDRGTSWRQQKLASPKDCPSCEVIYDKPRFQSKVDGLLPVTLLAENRLLTATYSTHDGGNSWKPTNVQEQQYDSAHSGASTVVDSHVLRVQVNQNNIATVPDTGKATASAVLRILWPMGSIVSVSFFTESSGWLVYSAGKCATFKSQCSQQSELLSTDDSGKSFKAITPRVGSSSVQANSSAAAETSPSIWNRGTISFTSLNSATQVSQAEGFDMKCVASAPNMLTWWEFSPYYDAGVYLGGSNVSCKTNMFLNSTWVNSVASAGWGIIPLWVGLQSPCISKSSSVWTISETIPYDEGKWDADAAVATASSLGMGSSIIYFDMEYYAPNSYLKDGTACSPLVVQFLQGWADELHSYGYAAGLYGSRGDWWTKTGGAQDFVQLLGEVDDVWISDGNSNNDSVWNLGSLPNSYWDNNQRIHQYILGRL
jgi:photosystem II stability/assembly factor-like uncharacterized protein